MTKQVGHGIVPRLSTSLPLPSTSLMRRVRCCCLRSALVLTASAAVYANTLVFAGRVFALAFFRIEGVGLKLLRALPPIKRLCVRRLMIEAGLEDKCVDVSQRACSRC